jgi:hypothetical protein
VVCALKRLHLHKQRRDHWTINKPYIPVIIIVNRCSVLALCSNLVNNLVLGVEDVQDDLIGVLILELFVEREGS